MITVSTAQSGKTRNTYCWDPFLGCRQAILHRAGRNDPIVVFVLRVWRPGKVRMLVQSIILPLSTFRLGEPIFPVRQWLERIVDNHHADVVAWKDVFVFSHGVVCLVHEVRQKVPRNVVGLVGFNPGFIHEFPSESRSEYQQSGRRC
jgi:hypothetical protein